LNERGFVRELNTDQLDELRARIATSPYWYHRIALPGGLVTPGWAPVSVEAYRVPTDLSGKRVLDVGAWDGFWTFEALKRGARQVVAIDDFSDYLGQLKEQDRHGWDNFDLCRSALGFGEDRCERIEMSVYEASPQRLGRFDLVFFFGTLYHLRHPLLALDQLSSVCDSEIYVESAVCDDYSPYRGGFGQGYPGGQIVAEFYPGSEYGNNPTNWWVPTVHCLGQMVLASGFDEVEGWKLTQDPRHLPHARGFVRGRKLNQKPQA
jgi:tRNA (mo5U34)-methyltransferase